MNLTLEPEGDVPDHLGQDLEEGDGEVGQRQVQHHQVHPRQLATLDHQRHDHDAVTHHRQHQDGGRDGHLELCQTFVALIVSVVVSHLRQVVEIVL